MKTFFKTLFLTLFIFVFAAGIVFLLQGIDEMKEQNNRIEKEEEIAASEAASSAANTVHVEYDLSGNNDSGTSKLLSHYLESCDDVVARMYIPDTGMETPIVDTEYYFRRNLAGEYDVKGVPYMNTTANFMKANHNAIIYGHRLDEKEDFGVLRDYVNQDFYDKHPTIYIETTSGTTTWEIISIFTIDTGEDSFEYWTYEDFTNASNRDTFMTEIKKRNIVDIEPYTYQENDQFITLSTCHYEVDKEDGRLVIVAVRN